VNCMKDKKKAKDETSTERRQREKREKEEKELEILKTKCSFFVDQFNTPCVAINVDGHLEIYQIKSKMYSHYLTNFIIENKLGISKQKIEKLKIISEAYAIKNKVQYSLYNRCAYYDGAYYLDLCSKDWSVIKITPGKWEKVNLSFPLFRRYNHMKELVINDKGTKEDFDKFMKLHNFSNDNQRLLTACYLGTCLISGIPHIILIVVGQQGSAKSSLQTDIRKIVDNSEINKLKLPVNQNEFTQQLQHHYLPLYDNVRWLQDWQQDDFCRAVTGEGFSKRELFSDDNDVIYKYMRCPIMNGINTPGTRADFLDRSVIITLERISEEKRRPQKEVDEEVDLLAPKVLKYLLDTVSKSLTNFDAVSKELKGKLPRMADFCIHGESMSRNLGHKPLEFYDAYMENIREQNTIVIENNIVSDLIRKLMAEKDTWKGMTSVLYKELKKLAEESDIKVGKNNFPGAPNALSRRVNELKYNLLKAGIEITSKEEHSGTEYTIKKISPQPPPSPQNSKINNENSKSGDISTAVNDNSGDNGDNGDDFKEPASVEEAFK